VNNSAWIKKLLEGGVVVTDGSWGTQMQARGLKRGENPDSWNLTRPDQVAEVAESYVAAGSRVILTNTFGANRFVLEPFGLADRVVEINRAGVAISRRAAGDRAVVFASIGPSGKMMMTGDVTADALRAAFETQAQALAEAGADALVVETMMDLEELRIALAAALRTGLPTVASMVFDAGKNKDRTMMGISPEQAAEAIAAAGANVVGANCGQGIEGFLPICQRLRAACRLPVWIKANAGIPELIDGAVVYRATPESFAAFVPRLVAAGAAFVGGCCGTDQRFIRAIAEAVGSPGPQASPRRPRVS
jgi:5-methyltetrahydrofolate--homocysteine methyltransferase